MVKIVAAEVNFQEFTADCPCNILKISIIYIDRLSRNIKPWDSSHGHENIIEINVLKENLTASLKVLILKGEPLISLILWQKADPSKSPESRQRHIEQKYIEHM